MHVEWSIRSCSKNVLLPTSIPRLVDDRPGDLPVWDENSPHPAIGYLALLQGRTTVHSMDNNKKEMGSECHNPTDLPFTRLRFALPSLPSIPGGHMPREIFR